MAAPLAQVSSRARHRLALKVVPPFTPTTPKPGEGGSDSVHWGKLMSKPVAVGASGVTAETMPVVANTMTAAMTTTNEDFVKRECT